MRSLMRSLLPVAVTLAALAGCAVGGSPARSQRVLAKEFSLTDARGRTVALSAMKGKVVLLDFWATWCTGCKEEMPWFMEFQDKYGARGLSSIGVALDDDGWKTVRPYVESHPINYPIAVADPAFAANYGFEGALPVTVLIDRTGRIARVHQGKVDRTDFEADIRRLLDES